VITKLDKYYGAAGLAAWCEMVNLIDSPYAEKTDMPYNRSRSMVQGTGQVENASGFPFGLMNADLNTGVSHEPGETNTRRSKRISSVLNYAVNIKSVKQGTACQF